MARLVGEWGYPELVASAALLAVSWPRTHCCTAHFAAVSSAFASRSPPATPRTLRIEFSDPRGEGLPPPRTAEAPAQCGRGLAVVAALADDWGIEPRTVGKTVFAELAAGASGDS